MSALLTPEPQVLSTLNADGSRRWLKPRLAPGRFWHMRRITAYFLLAVFTLTPYIHINGKPAVLADIINREFTFFGKTFLPTDSLLLALLVVGGFITIFFLTALFGRVWCGWACPQTVYMEFVFRPIERLLEGAPGRKGPTPEQLPARKAVKFIIFLLLSLFLAHTFLAYFVGVEQLRHWIFGSPFDHPIPFVVMAATTALMLFDFGYFREQMCIVACPYGRFQSVMLDRSSLIVSYDRNRGEPRGKAKAAPRDAVSLTVVKEEHACSGDCAKTGKAGCGGHKHDDHADAAPQLGDCIDCKMCVAVCPTGIDIRSGLQMECINCAQCIDACDEIMTKVGRPTGLIRYSSQAAIDASPRRIPSAGGCAAHDTAAPDAGSAPRPPSRFRPRVVIYPIILTAIAAAFITLLITAKPADISLLRGRGLPFNQLPSGEISNQLSLKITNRTGLESTFSVSIVSPANATLVGDLATMTVAPGKYQTQGLTVSLPFKAFEKGRCDATFVVTDNLGRTQQVVYRLLGPEHEIHINDHLGEHDSRQNSNDKKEHDSKEDHK